MKCYGIGIFDDNKIGLYRIVNLLGIHQCEFALTETYQDAVSQCEKYLIDNPRFSDDGIEEDIAWRLDDLAVQKLVEGKWEFLRSEKIPEPYNETME